MKIEIWSDVMCPFCYIGKNNFEQALEKLPFKDQVEVEWKSFQLDPTLDPKVTQNTIEYFREKKGVAEAQAAQMLTQVTQMGKGAGIDFNFEKALITNTFSAHKLLHLAKKHNKSNEMEEALFIAHFIDGKNVADPEVLISLATDLGIDQEEARLAVTSDALDYEVNQDILEARNNGVSGVPFFVLNGKYAVSGAQPVEVFENALQQTYKETVSPFKDLSGNEGASCDTDGCSI
ncbi:disulfide bond formation protein DsbA [Chryseobacterium lactis]|uniref:Disulfide bond formation protein DsbA n=1 Tax=Chryseobacterium lactis TaxID=1241981 RepID=A0A3G6RGT2_CHRLC|nr:DsbA family oxidoreductase [Chryseobacterium lactis]AZA83620.1 DsbA family oxidoreductase [Chryseobacterium lactis]AZB04005.1 DsbA family oxidoreductase [Chryseobacterium lactis]PNW13086.1 disulfide bond formation protein DsbA [Chryseobacterium lactis]